MRRASGGGDGDDHRIGGGVAGEELPANSLRGPPFIPEGCTILAGRPKIGKSWLMLAVGLDVACEGGDVLYLALEDNERRLQTRMAKLLGPASEARREATMPMRATARR